MTVARSLPAMALHQQCGDWIRSTFQRANVDIQMGPRLHTTFRQAGLPGPQMKLGAGIGGGADGPVQGYIVDVVASLLPMMERYGVAAASEVDVGTLGTRLREEAKACDGVMILPSIVGAWAQKLD